jgi:hypothetical protein
MFVICMNATKKQFVSEFLRLEPHRRFAASIRKAIPGIPEKLLLFY